MSEYGKQHADGSRSGGQRPMTATPELNEDTLIFMLARHGQIRGLPVSDKTKSAVADFLRSYGDQRDAEAYQRGKLEGARLAIEAAAKVCAKGGYVNPEYGVNNHPASDAIRALSPAKIVGEG